MKSLFPPSSLAALTTAAILLGTVSAGAQSDTGKADKTGNSDIEQLEVGNYWTVKETTFAEDGEADSEEFSTVVVMKKETLGGRPCFRMKQLYHEKARFDPKLAESDQDTDYIYWEFLENGNLYFFDTAGGPKLKSGKGKTPEDPAGDGAPKGGEAATRASVFTAQNPALYLKHPATAGELYQSFDTVGTVIATDRTVQTPAGEFVCHVYGFLTDAAEPLPHRSYTLEYWCPGIGFVKLEEYEISGAESRLAYEMELLAYHLEDGRAGGGAEDDDRRSKIENVH